MFMPLSFCLSSSLYFNVLCLFTIILLASVQQGVTSLPHTTHTKIISATLRYAIIPRPITLYDINRVNYPILSYPIYSYPTLFHNILSYHIYIIFYPPYLILSYPISFYPVKYYPILLCPILSDLIMSYLIISHNILT